MEERCESQIHSRYDEAAKDWKKLKFPESCGKPGASYEVRAAADTHVGLMGDRRAWLGVAESDLFVTQYLCEEHAKKAEKEGLSLKRRKP